jgi:hypothetical protein
MVVLRGEGCCTSSNKSFRVITPQLVKAVEQHICAAIQAAHIDSIPVIIQVSQTCQLSAGSINLLSSTQVKRVVHLRDLTTQKDDASLICLSS